MFNSSVYTNRRKKLSEKINNGILLFLGNNDASANYPANAYHFRQDSTFLYFFGIDEPGLAAVMDLDNGREIVFGDNVDIEDIIWTGPVEMLNEKAFKTGVSETRPFAELSKFLLKAVEQKRKIHYLPPYRGDNKIFLNQQLGIPFGSLKEKASVEFMKAVVDLRSVKEPCEIDDIRNYMDVAYEIHTKAMKMAKDGLYEYKIAGAMEGIALSYNGSLSFPTILSVRGEVLHGHSHENKIKNGDLLLVDAGAESPMHYATDHTRVVPVSGKFTQKQAEVYQVVLDSQLAAINAIKPGVKYKDIHLLTSKVIASGLKKLDLMKGDVDEAVMQGAHAFFFPHGLGHMMGLDVHDMEDIGQVYVGYDDEVRPSDQFGLDALRMGRRLQPGFIITVEPGVYFIPELYKKWKAENKFTEFINYAKVEEYLDFGGIRIEDDVLVTESGHEVLGKPIPKTIAEVEEFMKKYRE